MTDRSSLARSVLVLFLVTLGILVIPLVANQFIAGEGWSLFDFLLVGGLIFGTGTTYLLVVRRPAGFASAAGTALLAALGGAAVIVGEVDDAPGLILIGFVMVGVATLAGHRAAKRGAPSP